METPGPQGGASWALGVTGFTRYLLADLQPLTQEGQTSPRRPGTWLACPLSFPGSVPPPVSLEGGTRSLTPAMPLWTASHPRPKRPADLPEPTTQPLTRPDSCLEPRSHVCVSLVQL